MRRPPSTRTPEDVAEKSLGRALLVAVAALGLLVAAIVVVARTVTTTSARVSASTSSEGFLTAGEVVLTRSDDSATLLFDADNLYPGREISGCVVLFYAGSVPATVRLHADSGDGTGLDSYLGLRLTVLPEGSCPEADQARDSRSGRDLYQDRLSSLSSDHSTYATGLTVATSMAPGDRLAIEAVIVVRDDNRAAGLTTEFVFTFEARPT